MEVFSLKYPFSHLLFSLKYPYAFRCKSANCHTVTYCTHSVAEEDKKNIKQMINLNY